MKRKIFVLITTAVMLLCLCACNKTAKQSDGIPKETIYYNGAAGLTVTVPEGWYQNNINEKNLTATPEQSMDLDEMDSFDLKDDGFSYFLLNISSQESDKNEENVQVTLQLDKYEDKSFDEYTDYIENLYNAGTDGYTYALQEREKVKINDEKYVKLSYTVTHEKNSNPYFEEHYLKDLGDLYLDMCISYYDNTKSENDARFIRNNLLSFENEED